MSPTAPDTVRHPADPRLRAPSWALFAGALALIAAYFVIAGVNGYFVLADHDYRPVLRIVHFSFLPEQLASILWKVLLLLPATLLLSIALGTVGLRPALPHPGRERAALALLCTAVAAIALVMTTFVYRQTEVTDDENTYDFQAQTLLAGRLVNPPPTAGRSFDNVFIINDGRQWTGKYTLGHPIVIALGKALGFPSLLPILFSVALIPLLFGISLETYGSRRLALLTASLGAISPFLLLMASTRLSHTTSAFFLALFYWLSLRARTGARRNWLYALGAGCAIGCAFNVRAATALGFGLPFLAVIGYDLWKRKPGSVGRAALTVLGFLPFLAGTLVYNALITGHALTFPFNYYDPTETMGFGSQGHTPWMGLLNLGVSVVRMNSFLFGFPVSLLFLLALGVLGGNRRDVLNVAIPGTTAALYFFYWSPGVSDIGPIYYYEAIIPLILLSARGTVTVHRWFLERYPHRRDVVPTFLVVSAVLAALTFLPERLMHIHRLTSAIREPYATVREAGATNALMMVQSLPQRGWVFGHRNPAPDFTDDVIYCRYSDRASNLEVAHRFPDRTLYVLWYDEAWSRTQVKQVTIQDLEVMPVPKRSSKR